MVTTLFELIDLKEESRKHWVDNNTQIDCVRETYTCPMCMEHTTRFMVDGKAVFGGTTYQQQGGYGINHCGDIDCALKADKLLSDIVEVSDKEEKHDN